MYSIAENKEAYIGDLGCWEVKEWSWNWGWRSGLYAWRIIFGGYMCSLFCVVLWGRFILRFLIWSVLAQSDDDNRSLYEKWYMKNGRLIFANTYF